MKILIKTSIVAIILNCIASLIIYLTFCLANNSFNTSDFSSSTRESLTALMIIAMTAISICTFVFKESIFDD